MAFSSKVQSKSQLFTTAGANSFVVPANVSLVHVTMVGGGSGGGGGGAGQQVYVNAGDPNGVVTHNATTPAYCLDTLNNVAWWKTDGIASDTGWY